MTFGVDGATDMDFNPTSPTTALPSVDLGNGTESVNVWGNTPISAANAFYFRVLVTVS